MPEPVCVSRPSQAPFLERWSHQLLPGEYVSVIFLVISAVCLRVSAVSKLSCLEWTLCFVQTLRSRRFREVALSVPSPIAAVFLPDCLGKFLGR